MFEDEAKPKMKQKVNANSSESEKVQDRVQERYQKSRVKLKALSSVKACSSMCLTDLSSVNSDRRFSDIV